MACVLDSSVTLAWLLPDETNARSDAVRAMVEGGMDVWIPAHWLEIGSGLLMAERRGRINSEQVAQALSLVNALPLEDEETAEQISMRTLTLARKHGLTVYAAAYLELAQRRGASLATFDKQLLSAAAKEKIPTE